MELVTKTYTVCDATAQNIHQKAESMGCTDGEVLDRIVSRFNTDSTDLAKLMLTDYLFLTTEGLNTEQTTEVMLHNLLASLYLLAESGLFDMDKVFDYLKSTTAQILRDKEEGKMPPIPKDVLEAYRKWAEI